MKPLILNFINENNFNIYISVNTKTGFDEAKKIVLENQIFYFPIDIKLIINNLNLQT